MSLNEILKVNNASSYLNNPSYIKNKRKLETYNILENKPYKKINMNNDIYTSLENEVDSQEIINLTISNNNRQIAPTKASTKFDKSFDNNFYDYNSIKNSSNIFSDSIRGGIDEVNLLELKSNLNIKKKKVGRKRKLDYEENLKITNDNMIRKCKHLVITYCMEFLNYQIKKIYHDDIGEGIRIKKILDINNEQKVDNKLESSKVFLNKTLIEIFSVNISPKYTSFLPGHNRILIENLLNEKDEDKREKFKKIFNLTFADCIQLFLGKNDKNYELDGFPVFDEIKGELNENDKYLEKIKNYLLNFESIINSKTPRIRNKKDLSENNINNNNPNL